MSRATAPATLQRVLEPLARRHGASEVFRSLCRLAACALAHGTREADYLEEARRYDRAELDVFAEALAALVIDMEAHPFEDRLGPLHMELLGHRGQQWNGEFHTPPAVCSLMARMIGPQPPAEGPITLCEPACGAGAMILAYAESLPRADIRRLRVTAIDVSAQACDMCFINTTLWGIPCRVIHGNALSLEFWHAWTNIHLQAPWLVAALRVPPQGAPPDIHEQTAVARALQAGGQLSFGLEGLA